MKTWLEKCREEHESRCQACGDISLPKRLLDVGTPGQLRIVEGEGLTGQWFVLSHCWGRGKSQPMKTTLANFQQHLKIIEMADLLVTF